MPKTIEEIRRIRIGGQGTFSNKKWYSEEELQAELKKQIDKIENYLQWEENNFGMINVHLERISELRKDLGIQKYLSEKRGNNE